MKFFEELSIKLNQLGIFPQVHGPKTKLIVIAKRCGLFAIYTTYFLAPTCYFIFEAQTPRQRSKSLILVLFSMLELSWYSVHLLQREKYVALFNELNSIIEKSKSSILN